MIRLFLFGRHRNRNVPSYRWFISVGCDKRSTSSRQRTVQELTTSSNKSVYRRCFCALDSPISFNYAHKRLFQSSCAVRSPSEQHSSRRTSIPTSRTISAKPIYDYSEHINDDLNDDNIIDDIEQEYLECQNKRMSNTRLTNTIYPHEFRAGQSIIDSHHYSQENESLLLLLNSDQGDYSTDAVNHQSQKGKDVENDAMNSDFRTHYSSRYDDAGPRLSIGLEQSQEVASGNESLMNLLSDETEHIDIHVDRNELHRIQLQLETESTEDAIQRCLEVWNAARDRSDYDTILGVKKTLDSWYGPLSEAIELEQWLYLNNDNETNTSRVNEIDDPSLCDNVNSSSHRRLARDRSVYGPLLCLLPPTKIAVTLAHTSLSFLLQSTFIKIGCSKVVSLAISIANNLETELNVSRALRVRANEKKRKLNIMKKEETGDEESRQENNVPHVITCLDSWVYTANHLQKFLEEISGTYPVNGKNSLSGIGKYRPHTVRKKCKEILLAEGYTANGSNPVKGNEQISMPCFADWDPVMKVKLGAALIRLLLDHTTFTKPLKHGFGPTEPAFRYSRHMNNNSAGKAYGCISVHPELLKIAVDEEFSARSAFIPAAISGTRMLPMVIPPKDWTNISNGGYETVKVPFMRTRYCKTQNDALQRADMSQLMLGLNILGKTPWKVNKKILDVAMKCWEDGITLGDIPSRTDNEIPPLPEAMAFMDYKTLGDLEQKDRVDAYRKYREGMSKHKRAKQKNMDLHSLRCSTMLKLNQAQKFQDFNEIFFPYNIDFRGRVYPVPPHFSIVGSDLCRGLLVFAHPKPLGRNGLYWLKVHLANLAGADKMTFDGRAKFADENIHNIYAAVNDPFGANDWWMKFEDPFQGLAACHEIVQAIDSGDPENYMCSFPVHMDGSCNGLQHYAALGRDRAGGKAVNLCVTAEPQDVYVGVMREVIRRVAVDANEVLSFDESKKDISRAEKEVLKRVKSARLVNGLIDRGVVKRTVMTSVYGVTFIGAKNQISEKIEQKLEAKGYDIDEKEPEIHMACSYLASLTMEVMGQQFKGARETMNWLTECARLIAAHGQPVSFISPIGVPVVQPYRQRRLFAVTTLLQNVMMFNDSDLLPIHRQRQVSAFPPNFVHSLDSSHMLLTAIEMNKRGLYFSAVHDSYWTHPSNIEEMNAVLREAFIELYNRPLLEELRNMWSLRYPSITFPDVPDRGDLDLNDVRSAPYFFQ